jgi:Protein of unknown function (DUF4012)
MILVRRALIYLGLSLVMSAMLCALSLLTLLTFVRGVHDYVDGSRIAPPSAIRVIVGRPLMWAATQQPGIELTRFFPGLSWIERLGNDLDRLYVHGSQTLVAGTEVLSLTRKTPLILRPGQVDVGLLNKVRQPLGRFESSLLRIPRVDDVVQNIPGWLRTRIVVNRFVARAVDVERAARGSVTGLRQGLNLVLADSDLQVFLAVTNPAEKRGVQGIIGQYAVLNLTGGKIEKVSSGSNTSLVDPSSLPDGLSAGYSSLFGETNPEWVNMTLSPFADDAAVQMSAAWEKQSGEKVDAVVMMDTVALAELVASTGGSVTTQAGDRLVSPGDISSYLSNGIYFDFPEDNIARKEFQSELEDGLIQHVLKQSFDVERVARSMFVHFGNGRIHLWFRDPRRQEAIAETFIAGTSSSMRNGTILIGANNFTGNKMDFYVQPEITVQTCAGVSRVTVTLTNTATSGVPYPDYVTRRLDLGGEQGRLGVVLGLTVVVRSEFGVRLEGWGQERVSGESFSLDGFPAFQETIELGLGQASEFVVEMKDPVVDVVIGSFVRATLNSVGPCS